MLSGRSIPLVRVFGIRIGVDPSWFLALFIFIWFLTDYYQEATPGAGDTSAFLLATLSTLVPYFFCSLAALLAATGRLRAWQAVSSSAAMIAAGALMYSIVAIIGAGWEVLSWGTVLIAAGLPVYFWLRLAPPKPGRSEGGRG